MEADLSPGNRRVKGWWLFAVVGLTAFAAVGERGHRKDATREPRAGIEVGCPPPAVRPVIAAATPDVRPSQAEVAQGGNRVRSPAPELSPGSYKRNELLVRGANGATLAALYSRGWRQHRSPAAGVVRLISGSDVSVVARDALRSEFPEARFALNYVYRRATDNSVTNKAGQSAGATCSRELCYGPELIKWHPGLAACAAGVRVGVIDTGIDKEHPALAWRKLEVHSFPSQGIAVKAPDLHGTAVVALLAGDPRSSTPGLIPDADYVIADAFYSNGSGETEVDTIHLLWALGVLRDRRAQIINMSFFGPSDDAVHALITEMSRSGVVFVAAAGNGGPTAAPAYPAAYPEVIAVTAVDQNKLVYAEASHGSYIDMAAPGVRIWTALPNGKQGVLSGTSFAAPFVTAIAAVSYNSTPMRTAKVDAGAKLDPKAELLARLAFDRLGTGRPGERDGIFGLGLVQAPTSCSPGGEGWSTSMPSTPPNERRQTARQQVSPGGK